MMGLAGGEEIQLRFIKFLGSEKIGQMEFFAKLCRRQRLLGEAA